MCCREISLILYGSSFVYDNDLYLVGLILRGSVRTMDKLIHIHTISVKMAPAWNLVEELQLISVRAAEGTRLLLKENFRRNYFV